MINTYEPEYHTIKLTHGQIAQLLNCHLTSLRVEARFCIADNSNQRTVSLEQIGQIETICNSPVAVLS